MSIQHILRAKPPTRHVCVLVAAVLVLAGCAPRQAIVESEPGRGTPTTSGGEDVPTTLRSDLRLLAGAQEEYLADNGYYAARATDLGFTASPGVRVSIIQGDRNGWSAVAASTSTDDECAMYAGDVRSPRGYLTSPGQAMCR